MKKASVNWLICHRVIVLVIVTVDEKLESCQLSVNGVSCSFSASVNCSLDILDPYIRQHLSYNDCLDDKRKDYHNCYVLYYVTQLYTVICTLI